MGPFSMDDDDGTDPLAMLGVLTAVGSGLGGLWDSYNSAIEKNPIFVKVCSSCT